MGTSVYSLTDAGDRFTRNGTPIDGVSIRVQRGRTQFVSDSTGKVLASGISPRMFASQFWYASQWVDPVKP